MSPDNERVYVAVDNGFDVSGTLAVVDAERATLIATVAVGEGPFGVAVDSTGTRLYVTNSASGSVSVIDTFSNAVIGTLAVGGVPRGIAINPAGSRVYVANGGPSPGGPSFLSIIDAASDELIDNVSVGLGAFGVAVTPDGTRAYVASGSSATVPAFSAGSDTVSVIDTTVDAVVATVGAGRSVRAFGRFIGPAPPVTGTPTPPPALAPESERVYVANSFSGDVSVINTVSNTAAGTIPVGGHPYHIATTPDGRLAYLTNLESNLSVLDVARQSVEVIALDSPAGDIAIAPDGKRIYVAENQMVLVIDTATNAVLATIPFGAGDIAVAPDGAHLYVTTFDDELQQPVLRILDTSALATVGSIPIGEGSGNLVLSADGSLAYLASSLGNGHISVLDLAGEAITASISPVYTAGFDNIADLGIAPSGLFGYLITERSPFGPSLIQIVDTESNTIAGRFTPEVDPAQVVFNPEADLAYISNSGANTISVVDTLSHSIIATVPVGNAPKGIAIAPVPEATQSPTITARPSWTPTAAPTPTPTPTATATFGGCGDVCDARPCLYRCGDGSVVDGYCVGSGAAACYCFAACPVPSRSPTATHTPTPTDTGTSTATATLTPTRTPLPDRIDIEVRGFVYDASLGPSAPIVGATVTWVDSSHLDTSGSGSAISNDEGRYFLSFYAHEGDVITLAAAAGDFEPLIVQPYPSDLWHSGRVDFPLQPLAMATAPATPTGPAMPPLRSTATPADAGKKPATAGGGGCAISPSHPARSGAVIWPLGLLWLRRRSRPGRDRSRPTGRKLG